MHAMKVYNGHEEINSNLIDYFCGNIKYESVYSKSSKSMLTINFTTEVLIDAGYLKAQYVSLIQGQSYTFMDTCTYYNISSNLRPSWVLYISQNLHYVWYISNKVFHYNGYQDVTGRTRNRNASFNSFLIEQYINIHHMCTSNTISINVFPGLLPFYWMRWLVKPYATLLCSDRNKIRVSIIHHMHATLLLTLDPSAIERDHQLILQFGTNINHLGTFECADCGVEKFR